MTFTYTEKGHKYELDGKRMTGVTTVLGVLAKPQLIPWAAKMTAEWIRENCDRDTHPGNGPALGTEFCAYLVHESDLQEAVKAHTKKKDDAAEKGTDVHALVETYIKRCISEHGGKPEVLTFVNEVGRFAAWAMQNNIRFLSSETPTYSKEWFVAGTPDFTFEKDGKRYVGDLKTYKKIWDRVPHFQTAAYAYMLREQGEKPYDGTCIVNINKETNELTDQWTYDLNGDTKAFEACLFLYRQLSNF